MGNYYNKSSNKQHLIMKSDPIDWPLYKSIPLQMDQDGYTKSFDITNYNPKQVKQFYDNYGIVVFHNILSQEEIEKTIDDLWAATKSIFQKVDRNNPQTWKFMGMQSRYGFVNDQPLNQLQIWKNRANPLVYKAFKDLYQITSGRQLKQPLIACFDRGSMMRPSKLNPEWKTKDIYHFDIDPWYWTGVRQEVDDYYFEKQYERFMSYSYMLGEGNYKPNIGYTKLAGVLALSDTNQISGGFQASLGFQNYIKKWCQATPDNTGIQQDQNLLKKFQKVPMRKGSLMLFSRQLPHNIYQNQSQNFRYAQYLRMTPQSTLILTEQMKSKRKELIHPMIPKQLQRTDICKQIFMLK